MAHLQSLTLVAGDIGGVELARSSFGARHRLKFGDMDESIWSNLPSSLQLEVLKALPLTSNVRFRCVCREWYRVLSSYSPSPSGYICLFGALSPEVGKAEDVSNCPTELKKIIVDLSFLPKEMKPCASAGGLICFMVTSLPPRTFCPKAFYVCNPITRNFRQLVGKRTERLVPDQVDDEFVEITYDLVVDDCHNYKFFVGCIGKFQDKVHIYDSATSSWTNTVAPEPPLPQIFLHCDLRRVPVFQNGVFKVIDVQVLDHRDMERIDMQSRTELTGFQVSADSSYRIVGGNCRALFAVEVVLHPEEKMNLWREARSGWEVVSSLSSVAAKFVLQCFKDGELPNDHHLHCQLCWFNEDLLCIKLSEGESHRILTFHLKTKRWQPWYIQFTGACNRSPRDSMFSFTPSWEQAP
ncbi:hypothetical protein Mapa_013899 [Marchantia paleacea]|nr:hypothetical protein Mapa_013899 [Marchantia paleacea]